MKPIFIFSLPRSGSTLLQRVLTTHNDIDSISEPWILLPLLYSTKNSGVISEYSHSVCNIAINEFNNNLNPNSDFYINTKKYIESLYKSAANNKNALYFIDKTPRYYNIINDIYKVFPDAKFIFLYRNPAAIFCSIIQTWGNNSFKRIFHYYNDLKYGNDLLQMHKIPSENCIDINYENLVNKPEKTLSTILDYLEISNNTKILLKNFAKTSLDGKMGDKTGYYNQTKISNSSIDKWKLTINNPIRKILMIKYIKYLDSTTLQRMNYSGKTIIDDIKSIKVKMNIIISIQDLFHLIIAFFTIKLRLNIFFSSSLKGNKRKFLT